MTYFIFAGDMLVMAFMVGLVVWLYLRKSKQELDESARIPLEDEFIDELEGRVEGDVEGAVEERGR